MVETDLVSERGAKSLVFSLSIQNGLHFVWLVQIDLISVWDIELDLVPV